MSSLFVSGRREIYRIYTSAIQPTSALIREERCSRGINARLIEFHRAAIQKLETARSTRDAFSQTTILLVAIRCAFVHTRESSRTIPTVIFRIEVAERKKMGLG